MRYLLAAAALFAMACTAPTQFSPSRFGRWRVAFAGSTDGVYAWRADQLDAVRPMFTELDALGPDFVETDSLAEADVIARAAGDLGGACGAFDARDPGLVRIDAACAQGYLALRRAVAHEVVHAYTWQRWGWAGHACDWPIGAAVPATCHPTIRCPGEGCLMSRGLARADDGPNFSEAYTGDVADPTPAQPDLDLVAACQAASRCAP